MVTVRADYRVLNIHGTSPDKCVEDGKSAIRWVRDHAEELGIDPDRIVASGGSSGGHVAACTWMVDGLEAEGEDLNVSSKPDLLVLFNPVMSTTIDRIAERMGSEEIADELDIHAELWTAKGEKHGFFNQSPWKEWTLFLADRFLIQQGYLKDNPSITLSKSVEMTLFETVDPSSQE